ncbi:MAG TPA: hypothetical protein V6D19_02200 [Stenomitos sp.]
MNTEIQDSTLNGGQQSDTQLKQLQAQFQKVSAPRFQPIPIAVVVLLTLNLFVACGANRAANQARESQPFIYVYGPDGSAQEARPKSDITRPDAVLKSYAERFIQVGFTWNKQVVDKGEEKGFAVEGITIPTPLYYASFGIQPGFRESYLKGLAQKSGKDYTLSDYINGSKEVEVKIFGEPKVQKVGEGLWDVTVIATRIHHSNGQVFANEIFNHVLRLQAIKPAVNPWGERQTLIGTLVTQMQHQGLQIIQITPF